MFMNIYGIPIVIRPLHVCQLEGTAILNFHYLVLQIKKACFVAIFMILFR